MIFYTFVTNVLFYSLGLLLCLLCIIIISMYYYYVSLCFLSKNSYEAKMLQIQTPNKKR